MQGQPAWGKASGCMAPGDEYLLCNETFSRAVNVILSSNSMTYIKKKAELISM